MTSRKPPRTFSEEHAPEYLREWLRDQKEWLWEQFEDTDRHEPTEVSRDE